ncbi:MAG: DUF4231 domain-containing protein [Okeania sp. SIO2G4]|uniref:DUF4231 domain-containing protein n=1 Tax=unclassified Okeania TaxID=2634635 RepID=UPI0013BD0A74|nr:MULTISPECIES: DUF4231 domain-containing protein [unclassified Okeania]NEP03408.1 DUF4231 domain-containing protein [Okeania sp. SIO4D6]NEP37834.1 DUF4231 domain-containing protein [Okeania sp. SIO2H7]NEP70687.1 DUF4231 domain-containing protein [Okeania sp. SIO2G5]NEP91932.1 DUF4231 domain-containing protein [Okeania sp. SIO2F5]NEQ89355.1 DUF4231 domain-containing protein [Okeania sp. SIO2G4]
MTSSETLDSQLNIKADNYKSPPSIPGILSFLRILEYLSFATTIGSGISVYFFRELIQLPIVLVVSIALFIFLYLLNRQLQINYTKTIKDSDLLKKATLYGNVLQLENSPENIQITQEVEKALRYTQELIDDYKKTRQKARNIYYILQLGTIVFSGVTPILVLVDKLETGQAWLKWLPVICPAIASIVASVVTSFPFQENWISANRVVELLEAEQEKFILGANVSYRIYDVEDTTERGKKARNSIANFITKVNTIHLKQVEGQESPQQEDKKEEKNNLSAEQPKSLLKNT